MNANKLYTKFSIEKIWNKLKQHDKAMNSVLLILLPSNWVLQDGKYKNTVQYSGFKSSDKLTVDLYDDGNLADLQLTEYEHYIDGFEIIDGALVAIASVKPTQTMTVVVKGGFQANESEVGDLSGFEDEINFLANRPVNNNILINSNFANPVNQRGQSVYTRNPNIEDKVYTIDRWKLQGYMVEGNNYESSILTVNDGYITIDLKGTYGTEHWVELMQSIEFAEKYHGKTLTFSAKYRLNSADVNGSLLYRTVGDSKSLTLIADGQWHIATLTVTPSINENQLEFGFYGRNNYNMDIEWAKLELGEVATPYVPRLYAEELELCQRYFKYINVFAGSTFFYLNNNSIHFYVDCGYLMRDTPTVNFNTCAVLKNGTVVSGFSFDVLEARNNYDKCAVYISCTKSSHGLQVSDLITLGNSIVLDAEL